MEIQRLWGNPSRLHTESRSTNGYNDIYEQAMNVAFVQKRPFAYLSDWFDQLVPFWQLRLYVMDICGKSDFYKDVYEASRLLNAQGTHLTSGQLQLELYITAAWQQAWTFARFLKNGAGFKQANVYTTITTEKIQLQ